VDLIWSSLIFGGCAYIVFWKGASAWWFVLAGIVACSMGGGKLYQKLSERLGGKSE
jgi:hypothetical protein